MRRGLGLVLPIAILAIALITFVPHFPHAKAASSTTSALDVRSLNSASPLGLACPPGLARCTPAHPPTGPGFSLWQEVMLLTALAGAIGVLGPRRSRRPVTDHLPSGRHVMLLRPPQSLLLPL